MTIEPIVYTKNIETKIIESLLDARKSIVIVMAWFTNNKIKDCLLNIKSRKPSISIQIVVDENSVNTKYFLDYNNKFKNTNIEIKQNVTNQFLHHKFIVIDNERAITGSYNLTNRANKNLENIVIINSPFISSYYTRIFKFITTPNYIDENVELLFDYPDFTQSIISSYYRFSKKEYNKYKNKIVLGDCFTVDNGNYDEIKYFPGFIFNPKFLFRKESHRKRSDFNLDYEYSPEFKMPVSRNTIISWTKGRNENLILDYFNGKEDEYHLINDELDKSAENVERYFEQKIAHTYDKERMRELIEEGVDIIIENDIWSINFEPFINQEVISNIFANYKNTEKKIGS